MGGALPAGAAAADTLPQPPAQKIAWGACTPRATGLQCGTLSVPLNYADPAGPRINVAVIRKASTSSRRLGSLVVNPGGPGGSGVEFLQVALATFDGQTDPVMDELGERFDLVSFDPRGVGASSPVQCGPFEDPAASSTPLTLASVTAEMTSYVAGCTQRSASILPFLGTVDVARDLEQLRASLGDAKLSFLGYSYGTYLGATYAAMFPGSTGKLVLDGAIDPDRYANRPLQDDLAQAASGEVTLKRFLKSTKKSGRRVSLKAYRKLLARLERKPARIRGVKGIKRLTDEDVRGFVSEGLTARYAWPFLGMAVGQAVSGRPEMLASFVAETDPEAEAEKFVPGYLGNSGADRATNPSEVTDAYLASIRAAAPDVADDTWPATLATALWPHPAGRFAGPWAYPAAAGAPPILVIGTRFDPRTPYDGAVALRQQLGNARLLTFQGDGHTAFNNGASGGCIDDHVIAYFNGTAVPADGAVCKQDKDVDDLLGSLAIEGPAVPAAVRVLRR